MNQDQEPKLHFCKYCNQGYSNGKQLGGHMRSHLALIAASRKKVVHGVNQFVFGDHVIKKHGVHGFGYGEKGIGYDQDYGANGRIKGQDFVNGEKGIGFVYGYEKMVKKSQLFDQDYDGFDEGGGYEMVKKSQQEMEADNVYGLRENPKRSWRVSSSNSVKDFGSHPRKESICEKCGRGFDSLKALYGHMRCHSAKRSQVFGAFDANVDVANPIRKKRSYTRYKSPKHDKFSTDYEVEQGAICLMMISRGVRTLDEVKLVFSRKADFAFSDCEYSGTYEKNAECGVSVDESMGYGSFVNESELGFKKDLSVGYGSNWVGSAIPRSCDQDFGDRDGTDSGILLESKRRYKEHDCAICYKKFGSAQALGSHKRVHNKAENKSSGANSSEVEFKLTWVHSEIEWDPFAVVN